MGLKIGECGECKSGSTPPKEGLEIGDLCYVRNVFPCQQHLIVGVLAMGGEAGNRTGDRCFLRCSPSLDDDHIRKLTEKRDGHIDILP